MTRSGFAEFDTPDGSSFRRRMQALFLHRAAELVRDFKPTLTEVLEALPEDTFNLSPFVDYPDLSNVFARPEWSDNEMIRVFDLSVARIKAVGKAIQPWLKTWRLEKDEWVGSSVSSALVFIPRFPDDGEAVPARERVERAWLGFGPEEDGRPACRTPLTPFVDGRTILDSLNPQPEEFEYSARWFPQWESRVDFSRWIREEFDRKLTQYLDATEERMESAGLVRSPEKRRQQKRDKLQHFDWLIRFRLLRHRQIDIAREVGVSKETVYRGCKSAADLIQLTR